MEVYHETAQFSIPIDYFIHSFAFDEYPITSLFVLGVIIYVLYSYTDTPLLVKYAEMQNYI